MTQWGAGLPCPACGDARERVRGGTLVGTSRTRGGQPQSAALGPRSRRDVRQGRVRLCRDDDGARQPACDVDRCVRAAPPMIFELN